MLDNALFKNFKKNNINTPTNNTASVKINMIPKEIAKWKFGLTLNLLVSVLTDTFFLFIFTILLKVVGPSHWELLQKHALPQIYLFYSG